VRKSSSKEQPARTEESARPESVPSSVPLAEPALASAQPEPTESAEKPSERIQPDVEAAADTATLAESGDLLGLVQLFPPEPAAGQGNIAAQLTDEQIDRIAERVLRKLSAHAVESIAWDVVPDIAVRILRDELKKTNS
jgi:hypothetical protein